MGDEALLNNRYQLQKLLGTGGMAVVYLAVDRMLERPVAIKILRADYSRDEGFRERFHQEAKAAANLSHPNIVTVHDFGIDSERLFIVMEYVPGTTLQALLQTRGRLTTEEALPLLQQACAGIGYAHRAGLVHCDIKPHNFLITPDNRLKVTDFGIARALASITPEEHSEVVWGSPHYFAPEQAVGGPPSPASDVYSLGVVMFTMLTGRLPFTSATYEELVQMHRVDAPPSPREFNPAISPMLEQVMLKVLSKEPSGRYRTADQLGRVLEKIYLEQQIPPTAREETVSTQPQKAESDLVVSQQPGELESSSPETISTMPVTPAVNPLASLDWPSIMLGLAATLAVGGLIPLWLWVYFLYFPPVQ
jgi:serine/threonine-protein kinase